MTQRISSMPSVRWIVALLAVAGLVRIALLGAYPLMDTTEARYGSIALQMALTGDWTVPHTSPGVPFLGKPPLSFWLSGLSLRLLGINAFAARLPSLALSILAVALTMHLGSRLWDRATSLLAGLILATGGVFYLSAGVVMTDPALTATMALTMVSLPLAALAPPGGGQRLWGHLFFAGLGLGLLAKGPVAAALALVALVPWVLWARPWPALRALPWATGVLLALLIAVPWHVMVERRVPGFLDAYIVGEHIRRFLVPSWDSPYGEAHSYPRGFILLFWLLASMPWLLLALPALVGRAFQPVRNPWASYLMAWAAAPAVLFLPARNIMYTYVLPATPAMALLTARLLAAAMRADSPPWWARRRVLTAAAAVPVVAFLIAGGIVLPLISPGESQRAMIAHVREARGQTGAPVLYVGGLPDSASFYGHDLWVEQIEDEDDPRVGEMLDAHAVVFLVLERGEEDGLSPAVRARLREVVTLGDWVLWRTAS